MDNLYKQQVLIIGSGAAGLTLALQLAETAQVTLLTKSGLKSSSTYWAQGGISAVLDADDHFKTHTADTINAGSGLCNSEVVEYTIKQAPQIIQWLEALGMPFTRENGDQQKYHLTKEGGHSHRRVIHAADATGKALHDTLITQAAEHKNIRILEHRIAIDLIIDKSNPNAHRCIGTYALNIETGHVERFAAPFTVLSTGGANRVYLYSSNPDGATGDGIAMAWRAGCRVANMEFMQFHPTCLYHSEARSFLLSEVIRGEGGKLILPNGERFMPRFDERAELAPRDIVARAIDHEIKRLGLEHVYLDISHKSATFIENHFPNISANLLDLGINMSQEPIPVVPAAHYTCGGVMTDLHGCTDIQNLYAIGETAYTGLHGANRMASNSLLECLVFGKAAAEHINSALNNTATLPAIREWDESMVTDSDEEIVVSHNWQELRQTMWNYVGIVRTNKRLQRAESRVQLLIQEINEYYRHFKVTNDLLELRNLATVADLIIRSAKSRQESRGLHYTLDYPDSTADSQATILVPSRSRKDNFGKPKLQAI